MNSAVSMDLAGLSSEETNDRTFGRQQHQVINEDGADVANGYENMKRVLFIVVQIEFISRHSHPHGLP